MTAEGSKTASTPEPDQTASSLDVLWQAVREVEGLSKLNHLVPSELLWDRPPGLPSGAELLWAIHLVDSHVFLPSLDQLASERAVNLESPDYESLLAAFPCTVETLTDLLDRIRESRAELVTRLSVILSQSGAGSFATSLAEIIVSHDRQVLSAFVERLYESGLGA